MNILYVCRATAHQVSSQIDIPKKIAREFFDVPTSNIDQSKNTPINICHINDLRTFETIEIQPATNLRWSTRLNSFMAENGDILADGDLLVFEKLGKSFCVRCIKRGDAKYAPIVELFEKDEKHMLLSADINCQPEDTASISQKYRPYITAIKSKPFLLLAGISGTGKSRIVREIARACWDINSEEYTAQKPRNFEMIQVKPNWHDSSELIGYISRIAADKDGNGVTFVIGDFLKFIAKAWEEPNIPYFACLDEMNLAPVEQYFAEYLSVIESRKSKNGVVVTDPILRKVDENWYWELTTKLTDNDILRKQFNTDGIRIPQNLIVVGTVNMDETTFSFSRKVLDRAMTIEMNEVNLEGGLNERYENIGKLGSAELIGHAVEGVDVYEIHKAICDKVIVFLKSINAVLDGTPFKIAYRTRNEFLLYVVNNLPYINGENGEQLDSKFIVARAVDEMTNMKILSRIEGDETKVSDKFLSNLSETIKEQLDVICEGISERYQSVSLAKLQEMAKRLESGYTSFWS